MPIPPRLRRLALWAAPLGALGACSVPPLDAIRDLAAIHSETDWQPRSPAQLSVPPDWYLEGVMSAKLPESGSYEVADHRALELAILDRIGPIDVDKPPMACESASWLLLELLHDDHSAARIKAAAHLSALAGAWIERKGARLPAMEPTGSLPAALQAVEAARDSKEFLAALELVQRAPLADGTSTIRLLAGLGRRASLHGVGPNHQSAELLAAIGTRAILSGLEIAAQDPDPEVARACRERHDLLVRYAAPK